MYGEILELQTLETDDAPYDFTCLLCFFRKQQGSFTPGQWPLKETINAEVALGDIDQGNMRVIPNPFTKEAHGMCVGDMQCTCVTIILATTNGRS